MNYNPRIFSMAAASLAARKARRDAEHALLRQRLIREIEGLGDVYAGFAVCAGRIADAASRPDGEDAVEKARSDAHDLNDQKRRLLSEAGYDGDCLANEPDCARCGDTGFSAGEPCDCLISEYRRLISIELTAMMPGGARDFADFRLDLYSDEPDETFGVSPRENMRNNLNIIKEYAEEFSGESRSLILIGDPGLGKTFLSGCVAREVTGRGFSVIYDSAYNIISVFEEEKFGSTREVVSRRFFDCDLLIIDDLGCEMVTSFTTAALNNLVSARLMSRSATMINTNLTLSELRSRYSARIYSRVAGEYDRVFLFGQDVRPMLRE